MAFVMVSRTALVTVPILLAMFGLLHLRLRTNLLMLGAAVVLGLVIWFIPFGTIWSNIAPNACGDLPRRST